MGTKAKSDHDSNHFVDETVVRAREPGFVTLRHLRTGSSVASGILRLHFQSSEQSLNIKLISILYHSQRSKLVRYFIIVSRLVSTDKARNCPIGLMQVSKLSLGNLLPMASVLHGLAVDQHCLIPNTNPTIFHSPRVNKVYLNNLVNIDINGTFRA